MKLNINNQRLQFENNPNGINEMFNSINDYLEKEEKFFSHLIIDGKDIHSDHENYIQEHIANIDQVEVKTLSITEFVGELLVSLNNYTQRGIPEIEKIIEEFYQGPTEDTWLNLQQLLEGIEWIYETIRSIDVTKHEIPNWDEFIKGAATFETELPNLLEAIENKDNVLIADIIQYEILPQFQMVSDKTEQNFEVK